MATYGKIIRDAYTFLRYKCPIFLTGGIVQQWFGFPSYTPIPIILFTEPEGIAQQLLGGDWRQIDMATLWANWLCIQENPLTYETQLYPVANRETAASSQMRVPSDISYRLITDAPIPANEALRIGNWSSFETILKNHTDLGGTFALITDSFFYQNCILKNVSKADPDPSQKAIQWRVDFSRPLVKRKSFTGAYSSLAQSLNGELPSSSEPSLFSAGLSSLGITGINL